MYVPRRSELSDQPNSPTSSQLPSRFPCALHLAPACRIYSRAFHPISRASRLSAIVAQLVTKQRKAVIIPRYYRSRDNRRAIARGNRTDKPSASRDECLLPPLAITSGGFRAAPPRGIARRGEMLRECDARNRRFTVIKRSAAPAVSVISRYR